MKKRQKILELDYMRAIAAFGIYAIHATGGFVMYSEFNSNAMSLGMFINQFFRFGTPVFMMISGLVLFYNYRVPEEFDAKKFYKKKVVYLLLPYLIWSLGYFLFKTYFYHIPLEEKWISKLISDIFSFILYIFDSTILSDIAFFNQISFKTYDEQPYQGIWNNNFSTSNNTYL